MSMNDRTRLLIGEEGIARMKDTFVVVCGVGAVGGYALEGLVRAGIGRIRVVDADVFSDSNLNRQILATVDTVGRKKAEVAAERTRSINPGIEFTQRLGGYRRHDTLWGSGHRHRCHRYRGAQVRPSACGLRT